MCTQNITPVLANPSHTIYYFEKIQHNDQAGGRPLLWRILRHFLSLFQNLG